MQKYFNTVTKRSGVAIEGASVAVTTYPAGAAAAIYSDDGITPIPGSIVTTDANGHFEFYAADGRYTLSVSGPGITPYTLHDVLLLEDPTDDKAAITALQESVAENAADIAVRLPEIGTYALLRAYTGPLTAFYVRGVASLFDGGAGVFRVDTTDTTSAATDGTILVDALGRRWKREFSGAVNVLWFGARLDGATDDTAAVLAAVAVGETLFNARYIASVYTAKTVIQIPGTCKITGTITYHGTKVAFEGPGTFLVAAGAYTSSRVFVCTNTGGSVTNGAFSNISTDTFRNLNFYTTEAGLIAIYATDATGGNDVAACLQTVTNCRFGGFDKIFAHGAGGWGFSWDKCGARGCNYWFYLTDEANSYERHSATHCVFQNGGKLLHIDNPDGKVYWHGGSIDYCTGIGDLVAGYAEINSHIEYSGRTAALAAITNGHLHISGGMLAVLAETGASYTLITQAADRQLTVSDLMVVTDGSVTASRFTNRPFNHRNLKAGIQNSGRLFNSPIYYGSDMRAFEATVYGAGLTLTQDATKIEVTSSIGSGGSKGLYIDIPINGSASQQISWKFTASNTAGGSVFVDKARLSKNKAVSTAVVLGDASIAAGASGATIDSDSQFASITEHDGYFRLIFNCANLGSGHVLTITALEPYVF